jgi:hypothetical protein
VAASLTDAVLTEVLAPFASAKWLHFLDVGVVFGGFANPAHKAEYEAWLDEVVLPWCCKPAGDGGRDDGAGTADYALAVASAGVGAVVGGVAATGDNLNPLAGVVEVPTVTPGWVAVEVKARPAERSATA